MWLGSTPAGVGLVPLAPLTHVSEADLPEVVRRMADRINAEPRDRAATLDREVSVDGITVG